MLMKKLLPDEIKQEIAAHIKRTIRHAEVGWDAAHDEEDTLTGELGGALRSDGFVKCESDSSWSYKFSYKKLRGRGRDAPEKVAGADGLFQIEVQHPGVSSETKGFLFQAKKREASSRGDLVAQVDHMENLAPGGSAVIEYSQDGFRAQTGGEFQAEHKQKPSRIPHPSCSLTVFINERFLSCEIGIRGLYFDAVRGQMIVPQPDGKNLQFMLSVKHWLSLNVIHNDMGSDV